MSQDRRLMFQLDSETLANTDEPIEDWVKKYIPDEDLPTVNHAISAVIQMRSLFELEHRVRLPDGGTGWVRSRAATPFGPDGTITEWFGTASDITARVLGEQAVREREERHSSI
jgi:PAS domain-containing protein